MKVQAAFAIAEGRGDATSCHECSLDFHEADDTELVWCTACGRGFCSSMCLVRWHLSHWKGLECAELVRA